MGLLTNKTTKKKKSKGCLHASLGTKLNPQILNNVQSSVFCLCSGNRLSYSLFYFSFSHIISTILLVILPLMLFLAAYQLQQPSSGNSESYLQIIMLQADYSERKHGQRMWHYIFLKGVFQQVLTQVGLNISLFPCLEPTFL